MTTRSRLLVACLVAAALGGCADKAPAPVISQTAVDLGYCDLPVVHHRLPADRGELVRELQELGAGSAAEAVINEHVVLQDVIEAKCLAAQQRVGLAPR